MDINMKESVSHIDNEQYHEDPKTPWVHGPDGYIKRPELTQQHEKKPDIGADSSPASMIARALSYRASELTNYKEEFDDEVFSSYSKLIVSRIADYVFDMIENEKDAEEKEWTHLSPADQKFKALDEFLNKIDDGGWSDEDIMDIAHGGEQYYGLSPSNEQEDNEAQNNGARDIVHARLGEIYKENAMEADLAIWLEEHPEFKLVKPGTEFSGWWGTDVIDEKSWYVDGPEEGPLNESRLTRLAGLNESIRTARSEVGYSPTKASRHAFNKAVRAGEAGEIESQLFSMSAELPDKSIGDLIPIHKDEWENYSGVPSDLDSEIPSEKESYLFDLAYDVASGRVEMPENDIVDLDAHVVDQFGWSFSHAVTGHGADLSAQASRDEYYDDESAIFNEERLINLAGLNKNNNEK